MKLFRTLALAACAALAGAAAQSADRKLLIGTTSSSSSHYAYFAAVSQVINAEVEGVDAAIVETGASMDNMRRLMRDQIDIGLVTSNVTYDAWNGLNAFEGSSWTPMTLWVYAYSPQNVVVRRDSGVGSIGELAGRTVNPGMLGSATEATSERVFAALAVEPDWLRGSTGDVVDAIKDNRAVGYVKSGAGDRLDSSSIDIATTTPVDILGLSDDEVALVRELFPNLAIVEIAEGAAGEGYPAYRTWAFGTMAVAHPDLDEETAYRITKAVNEDDAVQAAAFAGVKDSGFAQLTMDMATTPLHPGAARYYREIGIEIPDRLAPRTN